MPVLLIVIYAFGWMLQEQLFVNWDISSLLLSSQKMLEGGTYSNDFFIPSPPSILFLYAPVVKLSQWFGIDILLIYRLYMFAIYSGSLFICNNISKKIYFPQDEFNRRTFILVLAATFFLMPIYHLGQRDCLLYVLIFPYLVTVVARQQKQTLNKLLAIVVGVLAGVSLTLKPQFVILPMLIEGYYVLRTRKIMATIRPEVIAILIVNLLYYLIVITYFSDYILEVLPYLLHYYYDSVALPWTLLPYHPIAKFSALVLIYCLLRIRQAQQQALQIVLMIALIAFYIIFLSQRTLFIYHLLPMLYMATVLLTLQLSAMATHKVGLYDYFLTGLVLFVCLSDVSYGVAIQFVNVFQPRFLFSFFLIYFFYIFYAFSQNQTWLIAMLKAVTVVLAGSVTTYMITRSDQYEYVTILTFLIMFGLFAVLSNKKNKGMGYQICFATSYAAMFGVVAMVIENHCMAGIDYKNNVMNPLSEFASSQPAHSSLYFISITGNTPGPLIYHPNVFVAERTDCLWMLNAMTKYRQLMGDRWLRDYIRDNQDKHFVVNMVTDDLDRYKPDLVLVDVRDVNTYFNNKSYYLDVIDYFSESKRFRTEWQHYSYRYKIRGGSFNGYQYNLAIYQREKSLI